MEDKIYLLTRIDGEYAYLKDEAQEDADELYIAMALLPANVDVGSRLLYSSFEFSLI